MVGVLPQPQGPPDSQRTAGRNLGREGSCEIPSIVLVIWMLCFHVLACFLGFPVGLAGPPSRWPLHKTG